MIQKQYQSNHLGHFSEERRKKFRVGHLLVILCRDFLNLVPPPDVRRLIDVRIFEPFPLTNVNDGLSDSQTEQPST